MSVDVPSMSWRFELQPQLAPQDSPSLRGDSLRRIGVGNSAVPSSISIQIAGLSRSLVCIRRAQKLGQGASAEVYLCQHQGRNGTTIDTRCVTVFQLCLHASRKSLGAQAYVEGPPRKGALLRILHIAQLMNHFRIKLSRPSSKITFATSAAFFRCQGL